MENTFRERNQKRYSIFRRIYDISMSLLFLGVGLAVFFIEKFGMDLVFTAEPVYRNFFGSICMLYGAFRLYRGIKQDY
ncbi:hypothetical protein [Sediminibacterium sp.]|jgi:hypothetical protein|uniref:hypothetical protein n=1 Tax=Sediminibacterium sp. TaxID=1917865 RepID=UPI00271CF9F2|nr:hypothetical protein [Sediminibacterium sp.]MDO8996319.1 hypothetical protein [Sediminibacterium sp.]MDP2420059.1 hypothetical protein [Sediminibacterium sp.]